MCVSKRLFWLLGGRWTGASRLAGPAVMGAAPLRQRTGPGLEPQLPAGWGQRRRRGVCGEEPIGLKGLRLTWAPGKPGWAGAGRSDEGHLGGRTRPLKVAEGRTQQSFKGREVSWQWAVARSQEGRRMRPERDVAAGRAPGNRVQRGCGDLPSVSLG